MVYKRFENLRIWLSSIKQAEMPAQKVRVAVIHNHNEDSLEEKKFKSVCEKFDADYYVPRRNVGLDIGALQELSTGKIAIDFQWDALFWSADDVIPMRKDFISKHIEAIKPKNVGVAGFHISNQCCRHVRTNSFCIPREVFGCLSFPVAEIKTQEECYIFEHFKNNMTEQIENQFHLTAVQTDPKSFSSVLWDTGHYWHLKLWNNHTRIFPCNRQMKLERQRVRHV